MSSPDVVREWIATELASGRLAVGDRLPGERALAAQLDVSRATIRERLQVLTALGMLESATGSGPNAGTRIVARPEEALGETLSLHLASQHLTPEHIMDARLMLEPYLARTAAGAVDERRVHQILAAMNNDALSIAEFLALDIEFHVAIVPPGANPLLAALLDALRSSVSEYTLALTASIDDWAAMRTVLRDEHQRIADAVISGDGDRTARLLADHIRGYYARTNRGEREQPQSR